MKRVVVFCLLCAGGLLYGMEDALLSGGAPARLYPAVELGHSINMIAAENMSAEDEYGQAYQALPQALPDEEPKEKAGSFVPTAMFSKKYKQLLASFSPHMVSAAFLELADDPDCKALKAVWESEPRQNNGGRDAQERAVAVKLFALLACKEKRQPQNEYQKSLRYRRSGIACFIFGGLVMVGGPLIVGLAHPHNCI